VGRNMARLKAASATAIPCAAGIDRSGLCVGEFMVGLLVLEVVRGQAARTRYCGFG
jgi:hypothetical protein